MIFFLRFDPDAAITDGDETSNVCKISVDVAMVDTESWRLASEQNIHQMIIGKLKLLQFII